MASEGEIRIISNVLVYVIFLMKSKMVIFMDSMIMIIWCSAHDKFMKLATLAVFHGETTIFEWWKIPSYMVQYQFAIEHGHFVRWFSQNKMNIAIDIVDLPIKHGVFLFLYVYHMVGS